MWNFKGNLSKCLANILVKIDLVLIELNCNGDYQKWTSQWPIECFARMELVIDLILFSTTRPTVAFSKSAQLENDSQLTVNTLKQRPNNQYFADKIFKCIFLNENHYICYQYFNISHCNNALFFVCFIFTFQIVLLYCCPLLSHRCSLDAFCYTYFISRFMKIVVTFWWYVAIWWCLPIHSGYFHWHQGTHMIVIVIAVNSFIKYYDDHLCSKQGDFLHLVYGKTRHPHSQLYTHCGLKVPQGFKILSSISSGKGLEVYVM